MKTQELEMNESSATPLRDLFVNLAASVEHCINTSAQSSERYEHRLAFRKKENGEGQAGIYPQRDKAQLPTTLLDFLNKLD